VVVAATASTFFGAAIAFSGKASVPIDNGKTFSIVSKLLIEAIHRVTQYCMMLRKN
jgi:hypothetical protein